ncbi:MAG: hypothetical protein C4298_04810 [Thermus sp.]|uniref:hypothetical protein n=1 Tax=Thermus sp. TaxID=275 RepID=UPI0033294021
MLWVKLHEFLGIFLFISGLALTLWALPSLFREPSHRFFRALRGLAYTAVFQVLLGIGLLLFLGLRPRDPLHLVYGTLLATVWHFLGGLEKDGWFYQSLKNPPARTGPWVAGGMLFALGLLIRVYLTGG